MLFYVPNDNSYEIACAEKYLIEIKITMKIVSF